MPLTVYNIAQLRWTTKHGASEMRQGNRIHKSELHRLSGGKHPDYKRQSSRKRRDVAIHAMRKIKAAR